MNRKYKFSKDKPGLYVRGYQDFFIILLMVAFLLTIMISTSALAAQNSAYTEEHIKEIQRMLQGLGYRDIQITGGQYDGNTFNSIKDFQRNHGLKDDGDPGKQTKEAMVKELAAREMQLNQTPGEIHPTPSGSQGETSPNRDRAIEENIIETETEIKGELKKITKILYGLLQANNDNQFPWWAKLVLVSLLLLMVLLFVILSKIFQYIQDNHLLIASLYGKKRINDRESYDDKISLSNEILAKIQKQAEIQEIQTNKIYQITNSLESRNQQLFDKLENIMDNIRNEVINEIQKISQSARENKQALENLRSSFDFDELRKSLENNIQQNVKIHQEPHRQVTDMMFNLLKEFKNEFNDVMARNNSSIEKEFSIVISTLNKKERSQAEAYFSKECDPKVLDYLGKFKDLTRDLDKICTEIDEILGSENALDSIITGMKSTLEEIREHYESLRTKELGVLLISDSDKTPGAQGKEKGEILKECLIHEYIKNPAEVKKLCQDEERIEGDYENFKKDLIDTKFNVFFCKMIEIDIGSEKVKPELKAKLKDLRNDIAKLIEHHFALRPIDITLGMQYNEDEHDNQGVYDSRVDYGPQAIIGVESFGWGYRSTTDGKIVRKAKVLIKG